VRRFGRSTAYLSLGNPQESRKGTFVCGDAWDGMDFSNISDESIDGSGTLEDGSEITDMRNEGRNSIALAFLDGFYSRVKELHSELVEEREESEGDDLPIEISFGGVGMKTYQIHSLTVSYFEAVTPLLCFHHLHNSTEEGDEILDWMDENRDFVFDEDSEESKQSQTMEWLNGRTSSITDVATMLDETGLLEHDEIKRVRTERHNFLHSPLEMLYISDWEDIISMSERCVQVMDDLDERVIEDINLHPVYGVMTDRDRNRTRY